MMKQLAIISVLFLFCTACVNELDNYDAPNGGVYGKIVDAGTGDVVPLSVEGSTGVLVRLAEENTNATKTVDFYAKSDGSFENTHVFNGDYTLSLEGPFVTHPEVRVQIKGQTNIDVQVTPYARIGATASINNRVVTLQYKVTQSNPSFTTTQVYGYWNFAPGVDDGGANQAGKVESNDMEGSFTFNLDEEDAFKDNLYKIRSNENKVYFRVGAVTEGQINYSPTLTVTIP
ncbi:MAG: DUF2012 domain-containing protein [Tannerellaceae bacterium]|nr:DUF2012 domain-containing protein [Tannerellaceae bacterium]